MDKTVLIDGMMCNNCAKHVEEAFAKKGIDAHVVLADSVAQLTQVGSVSDEEIRRIVKEAGYSVEEIRNG